MHVGRQSSRMLLTTWVQAFTLEPRRWLEPGPPELRSHCWRLAQAKLARQQRALLRDLEEMALTRE